MQVQYIMFLGQNQIMTPVASPLMCLHKYNPHFTAQIKGTIQSKQLQISLFSLYLLRNGLLLFLVSWQIVENCMCFFDQGQQIQSINSNISFSALKYIFGNITNSISGILVGFFFLHSMDSFVAQTMIILLFQPLNWVLLCTLNGGRHFSDLQEELFAVLPLSLP